MKTVEERKNVVCVEVSLGFSELVLKLQRIQQKKEIYLAKEKRTRSRKKIC